MSTLSFEPSKSRAILVVGLQIIPSSTSSLQLLSNPSHNSGALGNITGLLSSQSPSQTENPSLLRRSWFAFHTVIAVAMKGKINVLFQARNCYFWHNPPAKLSYTSRFCCCSSITKYLILNKLKLTEHRHSYKKVNMNSSSNLFHLYELSFITFSNKY